MALDPKTAHPESQEDYRKRVKQSYTLNYLEPPFPWKVQPFSPFEFLLNRINDDRPIPTGEQFAEGVSEFFGGGGSFGGAGAGSRF